MATRSLNKVQLIGNLTRDPELRYTPAGTAVCTFGLATNRSWTTDAGEKREEAEFHRIVSWNKLAELCAQLLFKGRKVYVEGRLQTREWTTQEGQPRQTTEIVISDMLILDSRRQGEERVTPAPAVQVGAGQPAADQTQVSQQQKDQQPEPEEEVATAKEEKPQKATSKKATKSQKKEENASEEEEQEVGSEDIPF